MKTWVNAKAPSTGGTALHFAAYQGDPGLIKRLIDLGADPFAKTPDGLNVLHYAAQNDQPWPVVYFHREFRMNVDVQDCDGNTALHWAAYSGAADALSCLLKWTRCVNEPNGEGQTPLHLGAKTAMSSGSFRVVRLLCFNGADRNILDNNGKRAIDYVAEWKATEVHLETGVGELRSILREQNECLCLMLRIPYKKIRNSVRLGVIFLVFHTLREFLIDFFVLPRISHVLLGRPSNNKLEVSLLVVSLTLFALTVTLFFISAIKDPGIHRREGKKLLYLIESVDFDRICPVCEIVRSPLTRHCVICNKCVERYDHHCPWIDSCVGVRNHNYFFALLITVFTDFIISICLSIMASIVLMFNTNLSYCDTNSPAVMPDIVCHFKSYSVGMLCGVATGTLSIMLVFCVLFTGGLCGVQTCNYCAGKTTNERFGSSGSSRRDRGCPRNCLDFCRRTIVPSQSYLLRHFGKENSTSVLEKNEVSLLARSVKG